MNDKLYRTLYVFIYEKDMPIHKHDLYEIEAFPNIHDYIDLEEHTDYSKEHKNKYGTVFRVVARKINYFVSKKHAHEQVVDLYVLPISDEEHTFLYP